MRFAVGEAYDGALLRSFLKREVGISTALLSRLKNHEQGILQNGKRVTVRAILRQGDVIDLAVEDEAPNEKVVPEATAVEVLFENSDLAVLNKPPFMATHPSSGHYTGTLANALVHRYGGNFLATPPAWCWWRKTRSAPGHFRARWRRAKCRRLILRWWRGKFPHPVGLTRTSAENPTALCCARPAPKGRATRR